MNRLPKKGGKVGKGGITKDKHKSLSMVRPEAFQMGAKKPEPDDRPRPMAPAAKVKGAKERAARLKRLSGKQI